MLIAIGVFGLVAMVAAMAAASWAASSCVAKRLRSGPFRLFDIGRSSGSLWHELTIRGAAVLAPLVLIAAAFTLSSLIVGTEARTMNLQILPGPAKEAGLVDGDHLLEIDGQVIADWDGVVRALKARQATHEIMIQRVDQRLTFRVTPNDQWHIGIASKTEHHPVAVVEAARHGIAMPFQVIAAAFAASTSGPVETAGTAQIVRMIGQSSQGRPLNVLFILALLGAYLWPAIIVMHLLDAASLAAFLRSHRDALSSRSEVPLRTLRVARMRQAFNVLLATLMVGMVGWALTDTGEGPRGWVALVEAWTAPAIFLLTWLLAGLLWGRVKAAMCVAALMIPCFNVVLLLVISTRARAYMTETGLARKVISA